MFDNLAIFDKVSAHLLEQNERSEVQGTGCAYRGPNGLMCAVGCLIPDERYDESLEGFEVHTMPVLRAVFGTSDVPYDTVCMLGRLQKIHDNCPSHEWPDELTELRDYLQSQQPGERAC